MANMDAIFKAFLEIQMNNNKDARILELQKNKEEQERKELVAEQRREEARGEKRIQKRPNN